MKCRDWDKRLPSLLDEPAGSPERLGLEAHLRQCDACRGSWELLGRLRAEAPRLGGLEPGERVWQGIEAAWAHPVPARAPVVR
ncbi:zf-HC2 domain-containing protein, partial [bacterium]|nr:zf-HC2 domain-containing protein [bacterium]